MECHGQALGIPQLERQYAGLARRAQRPAALRQAYRVGVSQSKLVYGPKQIDARIDQDSLISQQLSLWNQRGSQVILGSLLAIPIEKSLLYVQPLYLAAGQGSLPELKRVIAAFGSQIAMEETLDQSLQKIFGAKPAREATTPAAPVVTANEGRDLRPPSDRSLPALAGEAVAGQLGWLR